MNSKKLVLKILIILLLLISLLFTGCWNRRELDTLAIVAGTALDQAENHQLRLTNQIIKATMVQPQEGNSGGSKINKSYWNISLTGQDIFEIIRKMTHYSDRKLYWPHNQLIIFGNELAKNGIQEYLDFFARDPETRRKILIFVSRKEASSILNTQAELELTPALELSQLAKAQNANSQTPIIDFHNFLLSYMSKTKAPVAAFVEATNDNHLHLAGTAVFKDDKLVGDLNHKETRGFLWIIGEVKSGIISVSCENELKASLEILSASSKIIPQYKDGQLTIQVIIRGEHNLASQMCSKDLTKFPAWNELEKKLNEAIKEEALSALEKSQKYNTDIFGFGEVVHRKYPKLWKDIENKWNEIFPLLDVEIITKAKLKEPGLITSPISPK